MIEYRKIFFDQYTPIVVYKKLKTLFAGEFSALFESVINSDSGNYSYIVIGQKERLWHKDGQSFYQNEDKQIVKVDKNPLKFLQNYYNKLDSSYFKEVSLEAGVGFVDGFIGYVGYDMAKVFEPTLAKHMDNLTDELDCPDLELSRPSLIVGFSHKNSTLTMLSGNKTYIDKFDEIEKVLFDINTNIPIEKAELLEEEGSFSISKEQFFDLVKRSKHEITKGEIFQILISNRYTQKAKVDPFSFYRILRSKNPSPYLFLLEYDDFAIAGSSPEVMVRLHDKRILLRPIAGTRKRGKDEKRDKELELEMLGDEKERAEHIMLVDLGRNDVGRVAKKGTVVVEDLMHVEKFSHVMHMVSDVTAEIQDDSDMFDLFCATFTAGTMTGAPKIRAMELIADFEKSKRGFYSGSIALFGFDQNMDSAITIRSALIKEDKIIFHAGAGVVADSIDELEWLEVNNKLGASMASLKELS